VIAAVIALAIALVLAAAAGRREVRSLKSRIAEMEARTDAAQRWQDEVRAAIAASKGH